MTRRDLLTGLSLAGATAFPSVAAPAATTTPSASGPAEPDLVVIPTKVYPTPDAPDGLFPVTYRKLLPVTAPRAR